MPPLERDRVTILTTGSPASKSSSFSSTQRRCTPHQNKLTELAVSPTRDVIIGTNPLYDFSIDDRPCIDPHNCNNSTSSASTASTRDTNWVDLFTYLCVCAPIPEVSGGTNKRPRRSPSRGLFPSKKVAVTSRKSIVYPVARYPGRLNSPELVHQRRMSLQDQAMFRPVHRE